MRERVAQIDVQQQALRAEYEAGLQWVLAIVRFNPTAVLDALGVKPCGCCGGWRCE
ncbi:MAG: hypothetical protein WCD37_06540 [Chloroflexia bacterium]